MYDYYVAVADDVREYIKENIAFGDFTNREDLFEAIEEGCWVDDHVTGNGSGSYTMSRAKAKEYVIDNLDLLCEACREFGVTLDEIGKRFTSEDWEYFDVTIRCYLLSSTIWAVLDELVLPYDD